MNAVRKRLALTLFAAAAAWPSLYGGLATLTLSPLERAMAASWCGATPHESIAIFGHCLICWSGAVVLALAGALTLRTQRNGARAFARSL